MSEVSTEIGIHHGDLLLAQEYIHPDSGQPLLDDYLMHAIPRERFGTSHTMTYRPLHTELPTSCCHPSCDDPAILTSISTEWPLLLRLDPVHRVLTSSLSNVACPLTLKLGPNVEYQLISRVIFLGDSDSVGHYVTKSRLKNATYLYNDMQRSGSLTELGPLHILEDYDPNTSFVLYLRTSKACVSRLGNG